MEKLYIKWEDMNLEVEVVEGFIKTIKFIEENEIKIGSKSKVVSKIKKQLVAYFEGKQKKLDLEVLIEGTDFQKKVWNELLKIPYGEKRTYGEIAKNIGNPKAYRAVGMACNKNKIPIVIPCHRVIGANQKLVGFAGGLKVKSILLDLESTNKEGDKNV